VTESQLLFEAVREARADINAAVRELRGEIQSVRAQQCGLHGELSEVKELVARIDERQKVQGPFVPTPVGEPPNRGKQAVAVTVSLAGLGGLGATVWGIIKALSSG